MSTDPCADNAEVLPSHTFSLTPTIDFTSQSTADPRDVFRQPTQTLTSSEGRELMDCLLESIVKCMQIQNSLYRLVLLKLSQHVNGADVQTDAMSVNTSASDLPEARHTESTVPNRTYDAGALLCEVKEPLGALMRCADIQRGLFQKMIAVNMMTTENGRITYQYKFLLRNSCLYCCLECFGIFVFFFPCQKSK